MGRATLAAGAGEAKNGPTSMTEILDRINALIADSERDLDRIEETLTDGYAHALSLEAEKWRLEKRIAEIAHGMGRGDAAEKARELTSLSRRLDDKGGDLQRLRGLLGDLRRHADGVRVGSPSR
jgi:hypothetical protein